MNAKRCGRHRTLGHIKSSIISQKAYGLSKYKSDPVQYLKKSLQWNNCYTNEGLPVSRISTNCGKNDMKGFLFLDNRWGACSRTCGVGVRRSERFCDSPKPVYGGHYCVGERVRYESCKLMECPLGAIDFRSQQCQQFNGKSFGLREIPEDVKWIPKYADSE